MGLVDADGDGKRDRLDGSPLSTEYQSYTLGTPESNKLGKEIVDLVQSDMLFIGTVGNPAEPVYRRNDLLI